MEAARRAAQNASSNAARAQRQSVAAPFPAGRRVPKGTLRWYPVRVPEGREAAAAERLRKLASAGALDDAVVVSRERWFKRAGAWSVQTQPLYRGYVFAVSRDAAALGRELDRLGLRGGARQEGGRPAPLADDVRQWIAASMDGAGVLRASEGVIEGGNLRVTKGPLAGQEARVAKVDRHRRVCEVRVGREGGRGAGCPRARGIKQPPLASPASSRLPRS